MRCTVHDELLFHGMTVIDGNGAIFEDTAVYVVDGRIAEIGDSARLGARARDSTVRTIDGEGLTLMPGLVDAHVHLAGGDYAPGREDEPLGLAALRTAEAARRTLDAGVTTIRVCASRDHLDIDLRTAIDAGAAIGPRTVACGRGITAPGGHYHHTCIEARGASALEAAIAEHVERGADTIKLMLSPSMADGAEALQHAQFSLEETATAVAAAHRAGKPVASHATGIGGIRTSVAAGVDSVEHGFFLDEEQAALMHARGIYLVPTFSPAHYYAASPAADPLRAARALQFLPQHRQAFSTALAYGVPIAMGCDCGAQSGMPSGRNALELELMVRNGMSPMAALIAGTRESARLLRVDDRVGTVERGKVADLIAVAGDPLADVRVLQHGIRMVVQGGMVRRDDLGLAA